MNDKQQIITMLQEEFDRWEALLAGVRPEQISAPVLPANLSIKDVIAHLWAWQQNSIARLEAALLDKEPEYPDWTAGSHPDLEENLDTYNDRIYQANRERPWSDVHRDWQAGFLRFLELAQAVPEKSLTDPGRYPWLDGYALIAVLEGWYDHHHVEHLEPLVAWLRQHGDENSTG